jgi:hypothetical protein
LAVPVRLVTLPAPLTAVVTKAVVARAVVLLPALCVTPVVPVGNDGAPENVGDASGAAPVTSATGIAADAVKADAPLALT